MNTHRPDDIRQVLRTGNDAHASQLLHEALALRPDDPELLYLRGMLSARRGANMPALQDFTRALAGSPGNPALLFNRGLILFRLEQIEAAADDFQALCALRPGDADAWTNLGIIRLRQGRPAEALECLSSADRVAPGSPAILRMKANALREVGRPGEALEAHNRVVDALPDDPAALTDRALCLLSLGHAERALSDYQHALAASPADQTALAGLYMTANELGRDDIAARLMDYDSLLGHGQAQVSSDHLRELRKAALAHENLIWEPAGRSTRSGRQSPLLKPGEHTLDGLHEWIGDQVSQYMQGLDATPRLHGHPWLASRPQQWRLQSWITVLDQGGQQTPHIHPAGWLSGVFYVDEGRPAQEGSGDLLFGSTPLDLPISRAPIEHRYRPAKGRLVMFPSFFFHSTVAYSGTGPRISIAFDVIPTD